MEVHRAEKKECPYEGCDKFFYAAHYLSDHIRRQHKDPYQCENVLSGCDFVTQLQVDTPEPRDILLSVQIWNV